MVGDYSEYNNFLTDALNDKDDLIDTLLDKLDDKEERYYSQFTALENAMTKLNSQSSWISQMLGGTSA